MEAERGFLAGLDGGCQVPIAGHAEMLDDDRFILDGLVAEVDGSVILREQQEGRYGRHGTRNGFALARHLLDKGGKDILDRLYAEKPVVMMPKILCPHRGCTRRSTPDASPGRTAGRSFAPQRGGQPPTLSSPVPCRRWTWP